MINKDLEIKEVCFNAIPELIELMDSEQISIEKATEIAKLSKKEQRYLTKFLFLHSV